MAWGMVLVLDLVTCLVHVVQLGLFKEDDSKVGLDELF